MSTRKPECRKFSPNVFNKAKCQNCFRTKDDHSAEALENNRASRNVSKCGYLFVAPDWDFNVSVNRTKRWQRRWFVLYDDGELTYALDEFPDTLPQDTIDLRSALEVSDAEGATGNAFALAVITPHRTLFVKGTSREESNWWFDALHRALPRHLTRTKHKRNATFPCGNATIPAVISQEYCSEDDIRLGLRPKFLSSSDVLIPDDGDWLADGHEDVFDDVDANVRIQNALNKLMSATDFPVDGETNITEELAPKDPLSQLEELDNRRRNRRYLKRENRVARSQRSRVEGVSKILPTKTHRSDRALPGETPPTVTPSAMAAAEKLEYLESINPTECNTKLERIRQEEMPEPATETSQDHQLPESNATLRKSESLKNIPSETLLDELGDHIGGLRRYHSLKGPCSSQRRLRPTSSKIRYSSSSLPRTRKCSSDSVLSESLAKSANSDSAFSSAEHTNEGVFMRTGWLMRQTLSKEWSRHWFVLRDSSFAYYRDPSAENCGIMDGILDLNQVSTIREVESDRFSAFSLKMWDGKKHILAAETDDFRNTWMQALNYASNLWSSDSKEDFICAEIVLPEHSFHHSDRSIDRMTSPSSFYSLPIADEDKLTSSSDDQSEYFSLVDEDEVSELSSSPRTLPPSPPINRNVMSLVKEKSRTRSAPKTSNSVTYDNGREAEVLHNGMRIHDMKGSPEIINSNNANSIKSCKSSHSELHSEMGNTERLLKFDHTSPKTSTLSSPDTSAEKSFAPNSSNASTPKSKKECSLCFKTKSKMAAAEEEIRRLKQELKEAHASFDNLEMFSFKLAQDFKLKEDNYNSQVSLMTAKIDDLTSKFSLSEKNYRQMKLKASKSDSKERRRSSLKSKEGLSLTKEYENKLCELEAKISNLEFSLQRESSETEDSERAFVIPIIRNYKSSSADSSEANSLSETSSSETKGLFSRLQSLGSRVETVLDSLEHNHAAAITNPKILLQIRESDEPTEPHEACNGYFADVSSDFSSNQNNYPSTLNDFRKMFNQRLYNIVEWMKASLQSMYSKNRSDFHSGQLSLFNDIIIVLDSASQAINPCQEFQSVNFTTTLLLDVVNAVHKINEFGTIENLLHFEATSCAFQTLFQTILKSFAEYGNLNTAGVLDVISKIPQINFFCPIFNKLFPEIVEETNSFSSISERLTFISDCQSITENEISDAKKLRFGSLWNTLTEVPVQDDDARRPKSINSILEHIICVAKDVYHAAESQLGASQHSSYFNIRVCFKEIMSWCASTKSSLKENFDVFIKELKESCPMLEESTVPLSELSDATRQEITNIVLELSFLGISDIILKCLTNNSLKIVDQASHIHLPHEWTEGLKQGSLSGGLFVCPQCSTTKELLSGCNERLDWKCFVKRYQAVSKNSDDDFKSAVNSTLRDNGSQNSRNAKDSFKSFTCAQCDTWIMKLCTSEKQHEIDCNALQLKHSEELRQLEECLIKSTEIHDQELTEKERELRAVNNQLQVLKFDHECQVTSLKNFYEQKLNTNQEIASRKIYASEIEDLKVMFQKGLEAIASSHERITCEMERKHREEISSLEAEKERALQLEAQATVTAIEAIKKSHKLQLQEETTLLRKSLTHKFKNGNYELFANKYEQDLEKLKTEFLNITEMYSSKCMENVALEEKVDNLRQQLTDANNELQDLLAKSADINTSLSS